jgi:predicted acetyltransferase
MSLEVGPLASGDDLERYAAAASDALGFPPLDEDDWPARYERDWFRVVRVDGQVAGGLVSLPLAQYFGGRAVPMAGIHAVAVGPEFRGRRAATTLMVEHVRELAAAGVAISTLYPATQPVYRAAGYEQAGTWMKYKLALATVPRGARDLALVRSGLDDCARLEAIYRPHAAATPGHLERIPWTWGRIFASRPGQTPEAFRVGDDQGYAVLVQTRSGGLHRWSLHARDLVACTRQAGARLLALVADYNSTVSELTFTGPPAPAPALTWLLREMHGVSIEATLRWMVRILDVRAALEARGYAPGLTATVDLEVADALLAGNAGRWRLRVEGGRGQVEPGGGGGLRLGIGGLAPLYTGYASAEALAALGLVEGGAEALAAASAVFAGPAPWLPEIF